MKKTSTLLLVTACLCLLAACSTEPPVARFSTEKNSYKMSETVTFTNLSTDGKDFLWKFGDGDSSELVSPTHQFKSAGTFGVVLTVTNKSGQATYTDSLDIIPDLTGLWYTTLNYQGGFGGPGGRQAQGTMNVTQNEDNTLGGSYVYNDGAGKANLKSTSSVKGNKITIDFDNPTIKLLGTINATATAINGTFSGSRSGNWSATKL